MSISLVNGSLACYLAAVLLYGTHLISPKGRLKKCARWTLLLGLLLNTTAIGLRWREAGHPPFSNMYETMLCLAWCIAAVYFLLEIAYDPPYLGFLATLFAAFVLAAASFADSEPRPLIPALQSNWLVYHVVLCFAAYGAFTVSFAGSVIFLLARRYSRNIQIAPLMNRISYRSISFGFLFLTLGIITGSVWANKAWGSYWSWDPKETWALITWLIYALYLHMRSAKGWGGSRASWLSIAGFCAVIFTYFGVSFLLPGLHSYLK